jgi:hypothetical protein
MASRLDPTPKDTPKNLSDVLAGSASGKASSVPGFVKKDVAKRKAKEPPADKFTRDKEEMVTAEEVTALIADRPIKFGPKSSGFVRGGGSNGYPCLQCVRWYNSPASAHTTCEIVRISDLDDQVKADDTCKLFSKNGQEMPLLKEEGAEDTET